MGTLAELDQTEPVKALLIGDSGMGKTGALASLVVAGYNVRILDFDNGVGALRNQLKDMGKADLLKNVIAETLTDPMKQLGGKIVPNGVPNAFKRGLELLNNWTVADNPAAGVKGYSLGPVSSWGRQDVLVLDSMTLCGKASMRRVLHLNNRSGDQPYQGDWGDAQRQLEGLLELLYSTDIKCNVIVTSHISYIGDVEKGPDGQKVETNLKGYPTTLGRALSPQVGRYFNYCLIVTSKGMGANSRRVISTVPDGITQAKAPTRLPKELPIETGLADFFKAVS